MNTTQPELPFKPGVQGGSVKFLSPGPIQRNPQGPGVRVLDTLLQLLFFDQWAS